MKNLRKEGWSIVENGLLRDYYYTLSPQELVKVLPGHTRNSMSKQVQYLKRRNWKFENE